jgi:hypothetical protein
MLYSRSHLQHFRFSDLYLIRISCLFVCATYPTHLILLDLIILVTPGLWWKKWHWDKYFSLVGIPPEMPHTQNSFPYNLHNTLLKTRVISNKIYTLIITLGIRVQTASQEFLTAEPRSQTTTEGFMVQEMTRIEFCAEFMLPYHKIK